MDEFAWRFWWLIFPIMWFVFGIFRMALKHRSDRDTLELMKTYAQQGKDPAEIAKALGDTPSGWDSRWDRRWARRSWRYTPYSAWQRAISAICIAGGFWLATYYLHWPWYGPGLTIVAVIMSVVAAGALINAIVASVFAPRGPQV